MKLKNFFWNVITSGQSDMVDIDILRKTVLLNALVLPGLISLFFLGIFAFIEGNNFIVILNSVMLIVFTSVFFYLRISKDVTKASTVGVWICFFFFLFLADRGGTQNTAILWILIFPVISIFFLGTKKGSFLSILLALGVVLVFAFGNTTLVTSSYSTAFQVRIMAVYTIIATLAVISEELRRRIYEQLSQSNLDKKEAIDKLNKSIKEIKTLQDILPICMHCKNIRDDDGYWFAVEKYLTERTEVQLSHALCPSCAKEHYSKYLK